MTIGQELARKRPDTILEGRLVTVKVPKARRRTPADWPWYVWAPILCAPGAVLAYVLVGLAIFISHAL
jgi:hypothetical protein